MLIDDGAGLVGQLLKDEWLDKLDQRPVRDGHTFSSTATKGTDSLLRAAQQCWRFKRAEAEKKVKSAALVLDGPDALVWSEDSKSAKTYSVSLNLRRIFGLMNELAVKNGF